VIEFVRNDFLEPFAKMRKAWYELIRMQRKVSDLEEKGKNRQRYDLEIHRRQISIVGQIKKAPHF
jgi:hypothetical protein